MRHKNTAISTSTINEKNSIFCPSLISIIGFPGDLGFSDAYLDGWWSTPDLQAFMDWIHTDNDIVRDGFPGMKFLQTYEKLRFWLQSNTKRQAKKKCCSFICGLV